MLSCASTQAVSRPSKISYLLEVMARSSAARVVAAAALVAAAHLTSGCVAAPWAAPPIVAAAGGGARVAPSDGAEPTYDLRAGVSPFGITPSWVKRRGDLAFGYLYQGGRSAGVHEGWLQGGVVAGSRRAGDGVLRVVPHGEVRVLYDPHLGRLGRGASLGVIGELAAPASGPISSSGTNGGLIGAAWGEGGVGFYADLAALDLENRFGPGDRAGPNGYFAWTLTAGLVVRIPATAGVVWAFIH